MSWFNWDTMSWDDKKSIANRMGHPNPTYLARRNWDMLTNNERLAIRTLLSERYRRGQRVPGMLPQKFLSPAAQLTKDTVEAMIHGDNGWADKEAIRFHSNIISDVYLRRKQYPRERVDRLSQDALIRRVQEILKKQGWHR